MILFNDFVKEKENIGSEISAAINRVMDSGQYILGKECEEFEHEFAEYIGSKHGIGVNSGSDALYLAVKALGIGEGDEVITVSHTMISTVDAITRNGAKPVFVDIDPETYTLDAAKVEEKITDRTKAVLPVHIYGHPADLAPLIETAQKHSLFLIEDACQAHGSQYKHKRVGGFGTVGCFSFYPTKNLGGYGDGGMILTDDEAVADKLRKLRNYGQAQRYYHDFVGVNSRLDELQAAILRVKLRYLDDWNERRRMVAKLYGEVLGHTEVAVPVERDHARHVFHLYVIRSAFRDKLQQYLQSQGIQTLIHYPVPVHRQNAYGMVRSRLPVTERICGEILSLPINPWISDQDVVSVAEAVEAFAQSSAKSHAVETAPAAAAP